MQYNVVATPILLLHIMLFAHYLENFKWFGLDQLVNYLDFSATFL